MLIKAADDQSAHIEELERIAASGKGLEAKRAADELRIRKAGIKGESESAYLIDFHFSHAANWAVLHDLRLEHDGRTAQIDHLLINRLLEMYVLETKHFRDGLKITEDGEFLRWNGYRKTFEGMPSPIAQNDRHAAVLRDVLAALDLPERMGLRMMPSVTSLVLVAPNARVDRPQRFDTSRVIKADHLKKFVESDLEALGVLKLAKVVSCETLKSLAKQLAGRHRPLERAMASAASVQTSPSPAVTEPAAPPAVADAPSCKSCKGLSGQILYGPYGYYFKCGDCEGNTRIQFTCAPGHKPRLRKAALAFYRDCAECGTSALFHTNAQA